MPVKRPSRDFRRRWCEAGRGGPCAFAGPAVPAIALDNLPEIALEGLKPGSGSDGFVDRSGKVGQQVGLDRPRHHKCAIMGAALDVIPAHGGHQIPQAKAKGGDLFGKGLAEGGREISQPT